MHVLVVEDQPNVSNYVKRALEEQGYAVDLARTGQEALDWAEVVEFDLIVLDIMLPEIDGITVCRRLRSQGNPAAILMLTARDAIENRVEGLESGADDYLVKPFAPAELVARVHALLRRIEAKSGRQAAEFAGLHIDPSRHAASLDGLSLELTSTEFELLHYFLRHPRQVLERAQMARSLAVTGGVWPAL